MTERDLDRLLGEEGQRLLAELRNETDDDLKIVTKYRARYAPELVRAALTLTRLRERGRAKFSRADAMYFTQAGLEQASTEAMARCNAKRFAPFERVADLCSGIGGDSIALAAEHAVTSVDLDPIHLRMGVLNAAAYGVEANVTALNADVRDVNFDGMPAAFIDPARRSKEGRFRSGESEPPLDWCFGLAERGIALGVKAAPGIDVDVVPDGWELEFVSEGRELKESVLWSPALATARRRATILPGEHTLIEQPELRIEIKAPGRYLLDPDPAVTRSGLVEELAAELIEGQRTEVWKIDDRIAFLSADQPLSTPFGRSLKVEDSLPWGLKALKASLDRLDVGTVDIRKRGSAIDVDDIQRRLKLTGSRRATVVLTRVSDRPWAFVCS